MTGKKALKKLLEVLAEGQCTEKQEKAIIWAANAAIEMSGGGDPEDFLGRTKEAKAFLDLTNDYKPWKNR